MHCSSNSSCLCESSGSIGESCCIKAATAVVFAEAVAAGNSCCLLAATAVVIAKAAAAAAVAKTVVSRTTDYNIMFAKGRENVFVYKRKYNL